MIRWGILGVGTAGRARARALQGIDGSELVAVHRGRYADSLGVPDAGSAEALFAAVDVVVIATPSELHAEQAAAALRAGCHTVVDYPLARTIEEVDALFALAAAVGRRLHVEHIEVLAPSTRLVQDLTARHPARRAHLTMTTVGPPHADAETMVWLEIARVHRAIVTLGEIVAVRVLDRAADRLDAELHHESGVVTTLDARRVLDGRRGMDWRILTDDGELRVSEGGALWRGEPVALPASAGLFLEDTTRFLHALHTGERSYVDEERLRRLYKVLTALGTTDPGTLSATGT